jgi:hypothetical protein
MKTKEQPKEIDTLVFHRKMYERRMQRLKQRNGLTEQEIADEANDPKFFRRGKNFGRAAAGGSRR